MATSKDEIRDNCTRWAALCDKEIPKDLGYIFIVFPREGGSSAAVASNADKHRLRKELKDILKQIEGSSLIISPN